MYSELNFTNSNEVIEKYATLVKRIAYHLAGRLPASVQTDDLIQAGMIGLLEASKNYDQTKGASFETYAGIRIRGSMLDEIRKGDWVPRSVHRNARKISAAISELEHSLGRDIRDSDVANQLGVNLKEYQLLLQDVTGCRMLGYEDLGVSEEVLSQGLSSQLPEPLENIQEADFRENLARQINLLPERERLILVLYYEEELNLREIGEVLGVTESRVCQIHGQAMVRLQSRMQAWTKG